MWLGSDLQNHLLLGDSTSGSLLSWGAKLLGINLSRLPHHYHHPQWVLMLTVLRGQWKGVLCCESPRFAPGSIHYGHAESLSSFPKEQHVKVPRVGKYFVSFLFVCLSSMFLRRREGERDLNLKIGIQLWVSLKRHLVFFLMGEWC